VKNTEQQTVTDKNTANNICVLIPTKITTKKKKLKLVNRLIKVHTLIHTENNQS